MFKPIISYQFQHSLTGLTMISEHWGYLKYIPVVMSADFRAAGDQSGCLDLSKATIPDT